MNLENLNLVELNAQQAENINCGSFFGIDDIVVLVVGALVGAALTQDLDKLRDAWKVGYNAGRH